MEAGLKLLHNNILQKYEALHRNSSTLSASIKEEVLQRFRNERTQMLGAFKAQMVALFHKPAQELYLVKVQEISTLLPTLPGGGAPLQHLIPGAAGAAEAAEADAAADGGRRRKKTGGHVHSSPAKPAEPPPKRSALAGGKGGGGKGGGKGGGGKGGGGSGGLAGVALFAPGDMSSPQLAGLAQLYTPAMDSWKEQVESLRAELAAERAAAAKKHAEQEDASKKALAAANAEHDAKMAEADKQIKSAEARAAKAEEELVSIKASQEKQVADMVQTAMKTASGAQAPEIQRLENHIKSIEALNDKLLSMMRPTTDR
jgi:hypothetical protein